MKLDFSDLNATLPTINFALRLGFLMKLIKLSKYITSLGIIQISHKKLLAKTYYTKSRLYKISLWIIQIWTFIYKKTRLDKMYPNLQKNGSVLIKILTKNRFVQTLIINISYNNELITKRVTDSESA